MSEPKVTKRKITDFTPDPQNANRGTERGLRMLDDSLARSGVGRSIVVDANNTIIAGNKTAERAVDRGITDALVIETNGNQLVVVKRTDLDLSDDPDHRARMLAYDDNRTSEVDLDWDEEQLMADQMAGVPVEDLFHGDEWEALLEGIAQPEPPEDAGAQIDRASELQEVWQVERGQVWEIPSLTGDGCHRVMCGNSTDADDVARLMGGERADAVVTDPPYGVKRDKGFEGFGGFGSPIARRQYSDDWDSERPSKQVFDLILQTGMRSIIFGGNFFTDLLPVGTHWIVWDKLNTMPSYGDCELIWTNINRKSVKKITFQYNGLIGKEKERYHPTQKPVGLLKAIIEEYTDSGHIIFDPFLGSGTAMVACEMSSRLCFGIEIDPGYCAVILQRMSDFGLSPRLVEKPSGENIKLDMADPAQSNEVV
ncbi:MAG: hypothetical protein GTO60_16790 [Gammaproteobacteria bacterium]|nr:hypothetical protein [Gammaproteobacteria bacterium]